MKENEKKESIQKENKRIIILAISIIVIILVCYLLINFFSGNKTNTTKDLKSVMTNAETAVVYIWNSDEKKCNKCKEIKKHLDKTNIDYMSYNVKDYSKSKYEKLLTDLTINPSDFNYPALIYIKDGIMYSNIINIDNTKAVDTYIKEYQIKTDK